MVLAGHVGVVSDDRVCVMVLCHGCSRGRCGRLSWQDWGGSERAVDCDGYESMLAAVVCVVMVGGACDVWQRVRIWQRGCCG